MNDYGMVCQSHVVIWEKSIKEKQRHMRFDDEERNCNTNGRDYVKQQCILTCNNKNRKEEIREGKINDI